MSQQHTLGLEPTHQERPGNEPHWFDDHLNPAEQRLILLIQDYQHGSQQWRDYEPDGRFNGVRHRALLQWNQAMKLMTENELLESLERMVSDPRIHLYETAMSTPEDRRYELRW